MDHLGQLRRKLKDTEHNLDDDYPGQITEYRRQLIVDAALSAVNEILLDCSGGSVEETDYLYSAVSLKLTEQVHLAAQSKLLRHDLLNRTSDPEIARPS